MYPFRKSYCISDFLCKVITIQKMYIHTYLSSTKNSKSVSGQDTKIRFSLEPYAGDPSFNQWKDAMKMVARLPEGVPVDFRKKV